MVSICVFRRGRVRASAYRRELTAQQVDFRGILGGPENENGRLVSPKRPLMANDCWLEQALPQDNWRRVSRQRDIVKNTPPSSSQQPPSRHRQPIRHRGTKEFRVAIGLWKARWAGVYLRVEATS